jgi:hypothetical protein
MVVCVAQVCGASEEPEAGVRKRGREISLIDLRLIAGLSKPGHRQKISAFLVAFTEESKDACNVEGLTSIHALADRNQ